MRRLTVALAMGFLVAPAAVLAMGSGGMGGGGMPSGGMGGMSGMQTEPQYDPVQEYQNGQNDLQAGKYKDAVRDFQHVVDATPKAADAWLMLGVSKSGAGDEKGAEKAFERSVKLDDTVQAHRALALSLIKLKQNDKAQAELATLKTKQAACNNSCSDAAALQSAVNDVQNALTPAAPTTPSAAADTTQHLSLTNPQTGDGAYVRAVSLINEQRWDDALTSLGQAANALGPHPDILTYEGYVWRHKGDWTKAEGYYRQALAIDPHHRGATEYYGELKVLKGDVAGAKAMLAKLDAACSFGCAEAEELRLWIAHGGDPAA